MDPEKGRTPPIPADAMDQLMREIQELQERIDKVAGSDKFIDVDELRGIVVEPSDVLFDERSGETRSGEVRRAVREALAEYEAAGDSSLRKIVDTISRLQVLNEVLDETDRKLATRAKATLARIENL